MAKKAALAAALLVAVASATTSDDEECSQHVQGREFRSCQRYLQDPRSRFVDDCCEELRGMERHQCGCEAIRHAVQQAQQGGSSEHIYERARALPRTCGLTHQQCRFNVVFLYTSHSS
ncbi:2S seed storage albumin protein-like [Salvia miltiorrhiza]|uniref:2S seed storage albumin protein-like n=1 Tax=Salvia miltiorrhiza TaxID=226208 RepID=UPI0025AD2E09|nr:2S seed storage albumin protein-like [Salvia miltiorrhiza]